MKYIYSFALQLLIISSLSAQWKEVTGLKIASNRHHPVNFTLDGKGYLLTGMNESNTFLKDFHVYDPTTDSWTKKTDFPGTARAFSYGAAMDGKAYMGFGLGFPGTVLNDLWEYDPIADSWKELKACPCAGRRHPAFVAFEGKIYAGLGDGNSGNLKDWWIYDVATDSWTAGPSLPGIARHHPYYFYAGGFVYAGFGHSSQGIHKDFYKFDTQSNTWTQMNDFPGEERVAGTQFSYNNKGYILGGDGSDHANLDKGEFYEYSPDSDTWKEFPNHPGQGRWASGTFVIGDKVFFTSGETGNGVLYKDLWEFDFSTYVSVNEIGDRDKTLSLQPNPTNGLIYLKGFDEDIQQVEVYDVAGAKYPVVWNMEGSIDLSKLPAQMYFVIVQTQSGNRISSRVIKQ